MTNYHLYSDCIGNWYILTEEELSERDESPEYEQCNICGDTDEWHCSSCDMKNLAYYLKWRMASDETIEELTGFKVYAEESPRNT